MIASERRHELAGLGEEIAPKLAEGGEVQEVLAAAGEGVEMRFVEGGWVDRLGEGLGVRHCSECVGVIILALFELRHA